MMGNVLPALRSVLLGVGLAAAFTAAQAEAAEVPESDEPIVLAINEWTGQHITTHIAGHILKRMGYNVEFVTASYFPQFAAIKNGDIHASLEIWKGTGGGESFDEAVASGKAVDLGEVGLEEKQTWWYPLYVKEQCPGLPDWQALNDCAQIFAAPETHPKGRLVDWPLEWNSHNANRMEALGIDFVAVPAGSEGAIMTEVKSAAARQAPILAMLWSPHWIHAEVEGEWVELPAYEKACEEDPAWGMNPDQTWDCGWPTGWIKKIAWSGFADKWPAAYRFLDAYQISNGIQIGMMTAIDVEGQDVVAVTEQWVEDNQDVWQPWVDDAMAGN